MATGEQVKALIKAHYDRDNERFKTAALRIVASETRIGHTTIGREITAMVDASTRAKGNIINLANKDNLFLVSFPEVRLGDLVVSSEITEKIERMLSEYRQRKKLASFGLSCRRRLLLEGEPGTGKTMTASVIAAELDMPLFIVQTDKLITKYLGETSARLRQIFETIASNRAVYLFDEFDAIGADRSRDNEVGEMRRILNSFLQFIEADTSESVTIAATNNRRILDQALFRRFDDVMHYTLPTVDDVRRIVANRVGAYDPAFSPTDGTAAELSQLCQADITRLCEDAVKESLLADSSLCDELFQRLCADRLSVYDSEDKVGQAAWRDRISSLQTRATKSHIRLLGAVGTSRQLHAIERPTAFQDTTCNLGRALIDFRPRHQLQPVKKVPAVPTISVPCEPCRPCNPRGVRPPLAATSPKHHVRDKEPP